MKITQKIDHITRISDDYRKEILPAPRSVKIELTGSCNFRCGFCALRMRDKQPTQSMDWGLFKRLCYEMQEAGVQELGLFFLGESFTDPQFLVDAIHHAKHIRHFAYVFLTTNGSLAKPWLVRNCMAMGLDSLKFSVNWADEQQFEEITGVKGALFHEALANLKAARKVRDEGAFKCGIYASSIAYDGEQEKRMQALLETEVLPYVDEHYFLPLYSMGSFAAQREKELGYKPIAGNQGRLGALREPLPCWSAFMEGHITSSGKLSACCFDAGENWVMADLNEVTFMRGWNSQEFQELRRAHLKRDVTGTICQNCVAY